MRLILLVLLLLTFPIPLIAQEATPATGTVQPPTMSNTIVTQPSEFKAYDTPNDSVGNISLEWKAKVGQASIFYSVCIGKGADDKFDHEAARFPSNTQWKNDKSWPFWVSGTKEGYHYLEINVLEEFPAPTRPELTKKNGELQRVRKNIEQASTDRKNIESLEANKAALLAEIQPLQDEINKQKDEVKIKKLDEKNKSLKEITQRLKFANSIKELKAQKLVLMDEVDTLNAKVKREESDIKDKEYYFKVNVTDEKGAVLFAGPVLHAQAKNDWFNFSLLNNFIVMTVFCGIVLWFIGHAKKNKNLFLRRINGLDAIEEAVGRATEMGKPIFYQTGIGGMADISTICATVVLGKIAEKIALYDTQLRVPHRDPIVMSVCQEIVKESYAKAGRPDAYNEDSNYYVTGDQFAYVAAVNGMMLREKPAANFFMGSYMAEALLLTECGATTGAIQIAGTDSTDQLPFFITSCDYTLIGEEYYAASAYLSKEPVLVGTLKAQDVGKAVILVSLIALTVFALFHISWILDIVKDFSS